MVDTSNRNRKQLSDIKDISANLVGTDCTTIESFAKVFHSFEAVTNYLKKNANGEFGIALANVGKDLFETLEKLWTLIKLKQGSAVLLNPSEKEICETVIKTVKLMTSDDHLKKMNVIGSPELPIPASITKESLILKLDSIDCMAFESILEFNEIAFQIVGVAANNLENKDDVFLSFLGKMYNTGVIRGSYAEYSKFSESVSESSKKRLLTEDQHEECLLYVSGLKNLLSQEYHSEL